jgi:GNAT superfamily N-acetyltransferase
MDAFQIVPNPQLTDEQLNRLFKASWSEHDACEFAPVLSRSLAYFGAYSASRLIGFVNVAWDGGQHAFLLDPTVHPDFRRQGVGRSLVQAAIQLASARGITWLHVDYEEALEPFYRSAGFMPTRAGLVRTAS